MNALAPRGMNALSAEQTGSPYLPSGTPPSVGEDVFNFATMLPLPVGVGLGMAAKAFGAATKAGAPLVRRVLPKQFTLGPIGTPGSRISFERRAFNAFNKGRREVDGPLGDLYHTQQQLREAGLPIVDQFIARGPNNAETLVVVVPGHVAQTTGARNSVVVMGEEWFKGNVNKGVGVLAHERSHIARNDYGGRQALNDMWTKQSKETAGTELWDAAYKTNQNLRKRINHLKEFQADARATLEGPGAAQGLIEFLTESGGRFNKDPELAAAALRRSIATDTHPAQIERINRLRDLMDNPARRRPIIPRPF